MTHKVLKDGIMEQQRREGGGRGMFHISQGVIQWRKEV